MTNAAWLATPSVRVNPSIQRASDGIDVSGSFGNFLLWREGRPCATVRTSVNWSL